MDKHNKHHKNKAKGKNKPLSAQPAVAVLQEQSVGKVEETTVSGQKSKSSKGKQK